jgi:hypothetical protein
LIVALAGCAVGSDFKAADGNVGEVYVAKE